MFASLFSARVAEMLWRVHHYIPSQEPHFSLLELVLQELKFVTEHRLGKLAFIDFLAERHLRHAGIKQIKAVSKQAFPQLNSIRLTQGRTGAVGPF